MAAESSVFNLFARLGGLVVFRNILNNPLLQAFQYMLRATLKDTSNPALFVEAVGAFESALLETEKDDWSACLLALLLDDDNICIRTQDTTCTAELAEACLAQELALLQNAGELTLEQLLQALPNADAVRPLMPPPWKTSKHNFSEAYAVCRAQVSRRGYGVFARYRAFILQDGRLKPVHYPDSQRIEDLSGYEKERQKIIENTQALLEGRPAANVLLYGDAGTGKSSTVKAVAHAFAPQGLRLIEVKKHQLYQMPDLLDQLARNPLKFILFIDDLSFATNDDNFAALKAILEGSISGKSHNIVIYATSNRRHLVKERMSDRTGDDLHESDTRQELMSLSARFGLTVTFQRPDKALFGQIVEELARQYGVSIPQNRLLMLAEAFALRAGGRSPRVARQFVELAAAGIER